MRWFRRRPSPSEAAIRPPSTTLPWSLAGLPRPWTGHVETVTNALAAFPGRGTDFVLSSLRSPVIRGRHAAIRTIRAWGDRGRAPELRAALQAARAIEPNDRVRDAIDAALEDQPRL